MAAITVVQTIVAGLINPTFDAAAAGGDTFTNDGNTIYIVKNGGAGSITVTFDDTGSISPVSGKTFDPDVDVVIPAAQDAYIGPFTTARFGTNCSVTYSGVTSVTVAAIRTK